MTEYNTLNNITTPKDLRKLSIEQLPKLVQEIRDRIIATVAKIGGHLGASLGVVELTVALHYVFDTPDDLLIWDVGHQTYPHKILTGRNKILDTIRQPGGISGFARRTESIYDTFGAGHSSTSVSAALGMAVARDLLHLHHDVIAVIGDGAMSAGMAYEAMNNAGSQKNRFIVVLNDNRMSIAPAVGAMSGYLANLISSRPYFEARNFAKTLLKHVPSIKVIAKKAGKCAKDIATGGNFFAELGFHYIGPIDGHNLYQLVPILQNVKRNSSITKPVLLHIITEKGKGFNSPDISTESYHTVLPFDIKTKIQKKPEQPKITYTRVFSETLFKLMAQQDENIVAITAAMPSGTGLDMLAKHYPTRVFDVGIAEQHAVTFAGGLAVCGIKPYVAIYSTFLQRAYDQVVHDIAIQCLPVRFAIDRAGLVGADGPTHAGIFDIAYLANLPNFVVMAPSSGQELSRMVVTSYTINDRPSAFRFPRAEVEDGFEFTLKIAEPLTIGKGRVVLQGSGAAILSVGTCLQDTLKAADILKKHGYSITVADARFIKPLDTELITLLAQRHKVLITVEEGVIGGFGSHVVQVLLNAGLLDKGLRFRSLCLPDYFIEHNTLTAMRKEAGLDSDSIVNVLLELLS